MFGIEMSVFMHVLQLTRSSIQSVFEQKKRNQYQASAVKLLCTVSKSMRVETAGFLSQASKKGRS